jgi:hypothetical protein
MRPRRTAPPHNRLSYSAKAEYPVRSERSLPSPAHRNTGSPAFAGDDSRRCGASVFITHIRILATYFARVVPVSFAPKWRAWRYPEKGAGATLRRERGMPGAGCTRSRVRSGRKHTR